MGQGLNRRGIVLAAAALFASPALAQTQCEDFHYEARGHYILAVSCSAAVAHEYVNSGESPDDIATATMIECRPFITDMTNYVDKCRSFGVAVALNKQLTEGIRQETIAAVVRLRAEARR